MKQLTLAAVGFERYAKTTQRAALLAEMERVVPWAALCALIEPFYPKPGNGRRSGSSGCCVIYFCSSGSICRTRRWKRRSTIRLRCAALSVSAVAGGENVRRATWWSCDPCPGLGRIILAVLLAKVWQTLRWRDYRALRTLSGVAPVTWRQAEPAQKNVVPPPGWDLRRRLRRPATAGFKRPEIACRGARIPRPPPGKSECDQQGAQSDSP